MDKDSFLKNTFIPELGIPRSGKVRDIYENNETLLLVASDRLSMFDRIMNEPILDKGRILTGLSRFWFEKTKDIVPNHMIDQPDPNVLVVRKCEPLMLEMIVRGYVVGSLWRDYRDGKREKSGIPIPDGLKENDSLPEPIVTPSTKNSEGHDEDISKEELIASGIVTPSQWDQLETYSLNLYKLGQQVVGEKGLILVDTKYEFGLDPDGNIVLIDEIHTPDSSRYWFQKDVEKREFRFPDKEFVRQWGIKKGFMGEGSLPTLPEDIREKIHEGYKSVYEAITGIQLAETSGSIENRVLNNLKKAKLIKGGFILVLGEDQKITSELDQCGIPNGTLVSPTHETVDRYNESIEPVVCIAIDVSEDLTKQLKWPVTHHFGEALQTLNTMELHA